VLGVIVVVMGDRIMRFLRGGNTAWGRNNGLQGVLVGWRV